MVSESYNFNNGIETEKEGPKKDESSKSKCQSVLDFIKILHVEPFIFLLIFQYSLNLLPTSQMLQDKICRQWYNQSKEYCHGLSKMHGGHGEADDYKSKVLADAAVFSNYQSIISIVPSILWTIFVGAWIDKYSKGRKLVMMMLAIGFIMDTSMYFIQAIFFDTSPYFILLAYIPSSLGGGVGIFLLAINSYMTETTPPKLRALRFLTLELFFSVASPIGLFLSGKLLKTQSLFSNSGEVFNYSTCYMIALVAEILSLCLIYSLIDENKVMKRRLKIEMQELKSKERKRVEMDGISNCNEETIAIENEYNKKNEKEKRHPIRMLFDLSNVKEMYLCAVKKRPNKVRKQIWFLYGIMIITIMTYRAHNINFQFVQKIYDWDAEFYSSVNTIAMIATTIVNLTIVPILIKVVKLNDIPLAIVGSSVAVLKDTIMGTWLTSNGYYLSLAFGSIGGVALIGKKAYLSKLVAIDELGKIYSFMSLLETLAPFAASFIFTYLFKYTMNSYPSAIYQLIGALGLISVCILIWIDLCCKRPDENNNKNKYETNIISDNEITSQEGDSRL